jgi:hypothetical protein
MSTHCVAVCHLIALTNIRYMIVIAFCDVWFQDMFVIITEVFPCWCLVHVA